MAFTQSSGVLGQLASNAAGGTLATLYLVPAGTTSALSITACNKGSASASVTIVLQSGATQTYIENTLPLAPVGQQGSSYTVRAILLGPGQSVLVLNTNAVVDFTAIGVTSPSNVTTI